MLKQLRITHIVLIEEAVIAFGKGLNVLSGETGSGKSAIMEALLLTLGAKADVGLIRRGSAKASVEALFDIDDTPLLAHLLEEAGIDHEKGEDLIIRREISLSGKAKNFINHQACQLSLLRQISPHLGSVVSQHANQWLLSTDKHRGIIDLYGELKNSVDEFKQAFTTSQAIFSELQTLLENQQKRFREIETCVAEIEEIEEANLKNEEDEEIFAEYSLLTSAEALTSKADEIDNALFGTRLSLIAHLNKQKTHFEELATMDGSLNDAALSFKNALLEMEEAVYTLRIYKSRIENNPSRALQLSERLTLITRLKKKYGSSIPSIMAYLKETKDKLNSLENQDVKIEELQKSLKIAEEKADQAALSLTKKRKLTAKEFEKAMMQELASLNMPKVVFEVIIEPQKRNATGDDFIEFYLTPNIGEHKIPIKDSASGGELSRILLAIQTLVNESIPTLIFDEIDANIGGETAFIVGEKLKEISKHTQVLCITHFSQVATQADHHFQISKKEENGRTLTFVTVLEEGAKKEEISRMLGGKFITG